METFVSESGENSGQATGLDASAISSVELLDRESGVYISLTAGGNGAVMLRGQVAAAAPIPDDGLAALGPGTPLTLETAQGELEVSFEVAGEPIQLAGPLIGERTVWPARVQGRLSEHGDTKAISGPGVIHTASRLPAPGSLRRDLTVMLEDGGLLCVAVAGPEGASDHGQEEGAAALSHPGGYFAFGQVLLSTEADAAGRQRRATIELKPDRDNVAVLHGAGRSHCGCTARLPGGSVNTALFDWQLDGHSGTGRYELTRPNPEASS